MKITLDRTAVKNQINDRTQEILGSVGAMTGQVPSLPYRLGDDTPIMRAADRLIDICQSSHLLAVDETADLLTREAEGLVDFISHLGEFADYTPAGRLMLAADLFIHADDLISLSEAAELSGRSLSDLSNKIKRGQLRAYIDLDEYNPTHARRVRVRDVQDLPPVQRRR